VLAWIGRGDEPSSHALSDLARMKEPFEQWGGGLAIVHAAPPGGGAASLARQTVEAVDPGGAFLAKVLAALGRPASFRLPVIVGLDPERGVIFFSEGYSIGSGEQVLGTIRRLARRAGGEKRWLSGYARSLHGEVLGYQSPYPGPTPARLVRTTDGTMSAAWETEAVPASFGEESATFAFMVGLASGYGAHRFDLLVNDEPCCSFRSSKDTSEREWAVRGEGGAELSFRTTLVGHFNEMFGFMLLKLPRSALTPGSPVRLEVVGEAGEARTTSWHSRSRRTPGSSSARRRLSSASRREPHASSAWT